MYLSGTAPTFLQRLHALPTGVADLTVFRIEDNLYTLTSGQKINTNREYRHSYYELTKDPTSLTGWYV